jgi:hypothetical protein
MKTKDKWPHRLTKQSLIAVVLFSPIWFTPIRTAPVEKHLAVIA